MDDDVRLRPQYFLLAFEDVSARYFVFCACVSLTQRLQSVMAKRDVRKFSEARKKKIRRCVVCSCRAVRVP